MKRILLLLFIFSILLSGFSQVAYAQTNPTPFPASIPVTLGSPPLPAEGAWIIDPEVTTVGKNASRSGMLLDWTLKDYKWSSDTSYTNNPLTPFWLIIQRIVYALFLFVILVTAFLLIVTRGKSLSAKRFLPRFLLVVLLVTFSFSLVQFLYQIVDIFQGFFLKNPAGDIISSKDLLYIGFDYRTFQGLRVFGENYNESAFISLLLVKLTSFTYYVMAILLIFRKIILWFLIIISPVFPLLLLFYPLRNTAKIWIGEFFRWLLYAPLFAILLSGLVRLWSSGLPVFFSSVGVGSANSSIYPTSVNILLGGPGQQIGINNSVNLPDTFALYLVALLMLWAVIILPFILLQVFLDYMMAFNNRDNPFMKQIYTMLSNRPVVPIPPTNPTPPVGAGLARNLPFGRRFTVPRSTGISREIPRGVGQTVTRPTYIQKNNQAEISRLTNLSIPTMRDIARLETTKLSHDVRAQQEIERTRQSLVNIANPTSVSSMTERERVKMIHDRLVVEGQKGNQVASTILNAANTYNSYSAKSTSSSSSISQITRKLVQNISNPSTISSVRDQQKIVEIRQELIKAADSGSQFAKNILNQVNSYTNNQAHLLTQTLNQISHPEKITDSKERESLMSLREKIVSASKSGNQLATLITQSIESTTSAEQVEKIQAQLLEARAQGNPLAEELLRTVSRSDKTDETDFEKLHETLKAESASGNPLATLLLKTLASQEKTQSMSAVTKLKSGSLPQVNRIQQVSLDDYEAVKKMWMDNYKNLEVPNSQNTRKEWITQDMAGIDETISLLSSTSQQDVEKGMQEVSDILPFLLIGGFSQTEIIAYLKAKKEAGRNILENVTTQDEEEDTLLNAERAAKSATGHMAASAHIELGNTSSTSPTQQNFVNNLTTNNYSTSNSEPVISVKNTSLLQLSELPLVTMKDIAKFEISSQSSDESSDLKKIQQTLQGISNPQAISSPSDKTKYITLKDEIIKENQNGNPLAAVILEASRVSAPHADSSLKSISVKKSLVLPKENRIQQVSLDDYEAVKKMWEDNYRSQLSISLDKTSLQSDLESIDQTMNLLSSSNQEDVELGMKKVSDILPFLLLGGFSQTEIIAYLKAKKEAGKNVLDNVMTRDEEENTLLSASRGDSSILNQMSDSEMAEAQVPPIARSTVLSPIKVVEGEAGNLTNQNVAVQSQNNKVIKNSSISSAEETAPGVASSIVSQLHLPLPTLRDIASVETKSDDNKVRDLKRLLAELSHPGTAISIEDQKNLIKMRQTLLSQAQAGDRTAQMIVGALGLSQSVGAVGERHDFLMTLKTILDPSLAPEDDQAYFRQVRDELVRARQNSDVVAIQIMKLVDRISQIETESVVSLLNFIHDPEQIKDAKVRKVYTKFGNDLELQKSTSQIASSILTASQSDISTVSANKIRVQLLEGASRQDELATRIMKEYITLPQPTILEINNLYQTIQKSSADPFSKLLLKLLNQPLKRGVAGLRFERFPRENRTQKVSLDDYEQVKQMLYEMYLHAIVPLGKDGKEQLRTDWITEERQQVEDVINLLSSDDAGNLQLGMTRVSDILPFLLLGGFSQNEVLQYLKAKQEATVMALKILKEDEEKVFVENQDNVTTPQVMGIEESSAADEEIR